MNTSVISWHLKIERAKEHFAILEAEIMAWLSTSPIRMTKEKDEQGRRHALVAEIVNLPPLNRWSLISGDCVHNLRSALDSLLYGIAVHETGLNPPKDEARLQFPITSSAEKFNEDNNQKKIRSLSSAIQLEIENAQPYKNSHSELPPLLELLSFLDNFDKHRTLNVVAAVPHAESVYDMVQARDVTMTVSVYRTIISGKTEVVSFTIEPPNSSCDYKCEATIAICVAHSPGPSKSPFSELLSVLTLITEEVERVVEKLEAIVGQMQNPASQNPPQASHFKIDNNRAVTLAGQMDATHVAGEDRSMSPQAEASINFSLRTHSPVTGEEMT